MTLKTDRATLARYWNVFLLVAGLAVQYLATDPEAKALLGGFGGWVTAAIGLLNILLNRVPPALKALEGPETPQ